MTLRDAIYEVMSKATRPMHYKDDVWRLIKARNLWRPPYGGETPWHTARVAMLNDRQYERVGRGLFTMVGRRTARHPSHAPATLGAQMTWSEAVHEVMKRARGPLSYDEVCDQIETMGLRKLTGKTPWQTVGGVLYNNPLYRLVDTAKFELARGGATPSTRSRPRSGRTGATPMAFLEAAEQVLRERGEPMHWRELGESVERLVSSSSEDVAATLTGRVAQDIKARAERGERQRFCRPQRGFIGLASQLGQRRELTRLASTEGQSGGADPAGNAELSPALRALDDRVSRVELRLREAIRNSLCDDVSLVPSHVMQEVVKRLQSAGRRSARMGIERSADLSTRLEYCDLRELQSTITNDQLWPRFARMFGVKETLSMRFDQLAELRNSLRHIRTLDEIALKEGEAALIWFERILRQCTPLPSKSEDIEASS